MVLESISKTLLAPRTVVLEMKCWRTPNGFELWLKSPIIHAFFNSIKGDGPNVEIPAFGFTAFPVPNEKLPEIQDVDFITVGKSLLTEGGLCGAIFRAVNLDEGVTIKDEQMSLPSNGYGETLIATVKRAGHEIYGQYLAPWEYTYELTSREVVVAK